MNEKNLMDWILPRLKRDILDMAMSRSRIVELAPDHPDLIGGANDGS